MPNPKPGKPTGGITSMNSFLFGTGSHPVAQTDLDLKIFSPQLPRSRITRGHAPGRDEEEEEMSVGAQGGTIL